MAENEHLQKLISFLQQKGFVWGPEPEIYGGLSGFYTYAPMGKLLKNKVEEAIRKVFTSNDFMEVECPTIMPSPVWEASGHLAGFTDPMAECDKCKGSFKIDGDVQPGSRCPNCKGTLKEAGEHNLMMKTTIGIDTEAFNRPETATTTYLPFRRYDDFFRGKYPFGVFQIGKAYRNEISPRQHILRTREFTQAEAQLFILQDKKDDFEKYEEVKGLKLPMWTSKRQKEGKKPEKIILSKAPLGSKAYAWTLTLAYKLFREIGIPEEKMRLRQHGVDEKAFYAADAWDVEIETKSFGWVEVCGVHDRTDYDLSQHAKHSGKNLETTLEGGKKVTPHILEIAFGTDRPTFALLDAFYDYKEEDEGKTVLRLPKRMAPVQVAVFPLMKKDELKEKAKRVYEELSEEFTATYDESGSIGKRYLRASEQGTPYCVTIDYDSLKDDSVTVRDRDTEKQERVKIRELKAYFSKTFN